MLSGRILITGGSGTLGKAILTIARREQWGAEFTVYSRGEAAQMTMRARFPKAHYVLGDVRDYARLEAVTVGHDVVIHAAAIKHIPLAEAQPYECWQTNMLGSQNVVRACLNARVALCIGISTDKACRATTMYGASKLAMEKIFRATPEGDTRFVLVRYGNVVASRGSVIPIWRAQVAAQKPVTITDPQMTRFWMSPWSAARLVASATGLPHGAILVSKMKSLSLSELASIVAPMAEQVTIGLRSEEKQHEDLVHVNEPCFDAGGCFEIRSDGPLRTSYTSDHAERLTADEFNEMLAEAEALE